jgi:predicted kinase
VLDTSLSNEIVVITGIPGSGKSTLVQKRFPKYKRINLDSLQSRSREEIAITEALNNKESIVIDNTNTTRRSRQRYIEFATSFGVPIKSIYIRCPVAVALKRNESRRGKEQVPPHVVKFYNRKLEPPSPDEGFYSCEVIDC